MVRRSGRDHTMAVTYGDDTDGEQEQESDVSSLEEEVSRYRSKPVKKRPTPKKALKGHKKVSSATVNKRNKYREETPDSYHGGRDDEDESSEGFQDDSDDEDYGRPAKKKKKTPKTSPAKKGRGRPSSKKKAGPGSRGRPSSKSASKKGKAPKYYYVDDEDDYESEESVEEIEESDFSEDDYYDPRRNNYQPSSHKKGKKSTPVKGRPSAPKEQFPPVAVMVLESIKALKDNPKKGSTISAIKETILLNWPVNMKVYDGKVKRFLVRALEEGKVVQPKGKGLRGRFSVPGMKIKRKKTRKAFEKKLEKELEEPDYTPAPTRRDEERKRAEEERERQRVERQVYMEKLAHDKAMQPKRPAPKRKEEYVVEAIVGMKEVDGDKYYKVKWEGWAKPTWEEEDNVVGCDNLIKDYYANEKRKMEEEKKIKEWQAMGHYEVNKIMDVREYKDGTRDFLVRWKHCKPSDDTWEPEDNLDCPDMIERFMFDQEKLSMVEEKRLREAPKKVKRLEFVGKSARQNKRTGGFRKTYEDMD